LDINDFDVQQRISQLKSNFILKGMPPDVALKSAYKSLQFSIQKQAAVLSYMDVFLYLGVLFLICIPIMLFIKQRKSKEKIDISSAMH
jgi:DHA2 family multidrug resistance protein